MVHVACSMCDRLIGGQVRPNGNGVVGPYWPQDISISTTGLCIRQYELCTDVSYSMVKDGYARLYLSVFW